MKASACNFDDAARAERQITLDSAACSHIFNHMVNFSPERLDAPFSALADPTRRAMLAGRADGETWPGEGHVRRWRLLGDPVKDAADWIDRYRRYWEEQFDALVDYLENR